MSDAGLKSLASEINLSKPHPLSSMYQPSGVAQAGADLLNGLMVRPGKVQQ